MYLEESTAWYHGLPDNIKPVFCRNGYHQGDVLASWLYVMTIQPLLVHIKATIQSKFPDEWFLVKFYVDDGNFIAPSKIMREIIKILQNSYETFGYKLKSNKGCYLLGKCEDNQRAETRKTLLVNLGLDPSIIKIHPDNVPAAQKEEAEQTYGVKLLGAHIGTDAYIKTSLESYFSTLHDCARSLMHYPDLQGRLLMFRYCFITKPLHLMRTTRPDLMTDFIKYLQQLQRVVLGSIFKERLSDSLFNFLCLQISKGGLGIHRADEVAPASYTASWISYLKSQDFDARLDKIQYLQIEELPPRMQQLYKMVKKFKLETQDSGDGIQDFMAKLIEINTMKERNDREASTEMEKRQSLQNLLTYNIQDEADEEDTSIFQ